MLLSSVSDASTYKTVLSGSVRPPAAKTVVVSSVGSLQPQFSRLLDTKLGISILQFRDTDGNIAQTLPSQQQLAAYARPGGVTQPKNGAFA